MFATTWTFDPTHSQIGFSVRHMMVSKVRGEFTKWTGSLDFDAARPEATKVAVTIDAASIDTHEPQRDGHLRSPDFFDAEKFPTLTFTSTRIERDGEHYRVTGDLTIRGVSRPVVLDAEFGGQVTDMQGNTRAGFSAKTSIDRKDYGLVWNMVLEAGGIAVADKIEITLEVEAVKDRKSVV
jgi:polyisoprenoid-binding protein YceI